MTIRLALRSDLPGRSPGECRWLGRCLTYQTKSGTSALNSGGPKAVPARPRELWDPHERRPRALSAGLNGTERLEPPSQARGLQRSQTFSALVCSDRSKGASTDDIDVSGGTVPD